MNPSLLSPVLGQIKEDLSLFGGQPGTGSLQQSHIVFSFVLAILAIILVPSYINTYSPLRQHWWHIESSLTSWVTTDLLYCYILTFDPAQKYYSKVMHWKEVTHFNGQ